MNIRIFCGTIKTMTNYKKLSVVLISIILGLLSGLLSSNILSSLNNTGFFDGGFGTILGVEIIVPGLLFGLTVCFVLQFLLKVKFNIFQSLVFIIGSIITFIIASAFYFVNPIVSGIIGGVGVCIAYKTFKINICLLEKIALILISTLSSIISFVSISNEEATLILFISWQGAMIGCLAYLTIRKIEKESNLQITSMPSME